MLLFTLHFCYSIDNFIQFLLHYQLFSYWPYIKTAGFTGSIKNSYLAKHYFKFMRI